MESGAWRVTGSRVYVKGLGDYIVYSDLNVYYN